MYGVSISGLMSAPTPASDIGSQHIGHYLGEENVNGTLWCVAVVSTLTSTIIAIFALNMLKQVEAGMYRLFTEVLWKPFLQLPYLFCMIGIMAQLLAFISYLTISWGEHRTLCCVLSCLPLFFISQQLYQTRIVFATDVVIDVQDAIASRRHVMLSPTQIVAKLERYVQDRSEILLKEDFIQYITPPNLKLGIDLSIDAGSNERLKRRSELLPRPVLSPYTVQLAEALFERLVQQHIENVVASTDTSRAQKTLLRGIAP